MIAIFLFYNKSYGMPRAFSFSDEFKHCSLITFDDEHWMMTQLCKTGMRSKVLKVGVDIDRFLNLLFLAKTLTAVTVAYIEKPAKRRWFPLMLNSCNEICRLQSGIDVGMTFNVAHLYKKILCGGKNYEIDYAWRRKTDGRRRSIGSIKRSIRCSTATS